MKTKFLPVTTLCLLLIISCSKDEDQIAPDNRQLKATAVINGATTYQTIDGFGFSTAWCGTLTSAKNNALYNTLGFSLLRVRIDPWNQWAAETANAAAAHSRGAKVLGTPWTPPPAMKSNNNHVAGSLKTTEYSNYANWLKSAATSIGLDYVSVQNEPDIDVTYESCDWTPTQLLNFVKNNVSVVGKPIVTAESFHFDDAYSDPILNDGTAVGKISFVGGHIYGGGLFTHQNALNKGKRVWQTEHFIANSRDNINNAIVQAKEIQDCMNNRMSAYFYWWVNDDDASVNLVNQSGTIYKAGYVAGQFAKWIRPGKVRIAATYNPTPGVYVTAYKNNGLVIVAVNTTSSTIWQTFQLQNISGVSSLIVHRTSGSLNMSNVGTATVSNNTFGLNMPPYSVSTCHQF